MSESALTTLKVSVLTESPTNPRRTYDEASLAELASSIQSMGLLQPVVVRRLPGKKHYEIVCGHRRVRAAKLAGVDEVPAIVKTLTDREAGYAALVENSQRDSVPPLEEGAAFEALVNLGEDPENIAATVGHTTKFVRDRLKLQQLSESLRPALASGQLPLGGALLVATLPRERQDELAKKALKPDPSAKAWTVDSVRNAVLQSSVLLIRAPWPLDDDSYTPIACAVCTSRSDAQAELFDGSSQSAACLLRRCYDSKREQYFARKAAEGYTIHKGMNAPAGWVHPKWCIGASTLTWGEVAAPDTPKLLLDSEYVSGVVYLDQASILAQLEREGRPALIRVETPESREAERAREAARLAAYDDDVTSVAHVLAQVLAVDGDDRAMRAATVALLQLAARQLWQFNPTLKRRWGLEVGEVEREGQLLADSSPAAVRQLFADALAIVARELAGQNTRAAYQALCALTGAGVTDDDVEPGDGVADTEYFDEDEPDLDEETDDDADDCAAAEG